MSDVARDLLSALHSAPEQPNEGFTKLATVTGYSGGMLVRFDGESDPSGRAYMRLGSVGATAVGTRVLMIRAGTTWVVAGPLIA